MTVARPMGGNASEGDRSFTASFAFFSLPRRLFPSREARSLYPNHRPL